MREDILTMLQGRLPEFSKGQKRIALYILEAYDKAAFMTAKNLSQKVEVSESTVVRFAAELGFDGYPSMQKALQDMVLHRLTPVQRMEIANDRMGKDDVVSAVLQTDMEKLRQTSEAVSREDFSGAVSAILKAKRIYVIGVRSVSALAVFMGHYLHYMFDDVQVITASGTSELFEKLIGVSSDDVVIAFSFPRYSTATIKGVQYSRSVGAKVIGITDSNFSTLAENSDYVLAAKSDMVSLVDSLVAPLSLTNALLVALASAREQRLSKTLEGLERVWEEYEVYEKRGAGQ
ncbi:MAG: MurR/RpiR family transcriptional regulator [Oscillospiraceae bacterium]|nr:MurR/RpiR family transcriptional regulator [Oscillospiraceae bacterium]